MNLQSNSKLISIILTICLIATVISVPAVYSDTVYAAQTPATAILNNSKITVPAEMIAGKKFPLTLTGDRQSISATTEGETRYIPYSYKITHSDGIINSPNGLKPDSKGRFTYYIKFTVPGKKIIEATWLNQKFQNGKWQNVKKVKTSISIDIKGTLKLNANKGSVKTKSFYKKQNEKAGTLPNPTRKGYKFKGWYTKKTGGTKIKSSTKIKFKAMSKTLYARWTSIKGSYKVSLNANGGKTPTKSILVIKGKKYNRFENLPTPTRSNYNFIGWYTKKTGGSIVKNTTTVGKKSKHTLYARWKNKYTVTLNGNGGKVESSKKTKTVTLGKPYGALPIPTKTNYNFAGWYTKKSGGIRITNSTTVSVTGNQTLYARWTENGAIISNYDETAKSIIAKIGTQAPSQCSVYSMSYCTAIRNKKQVSPSSYLLGALAYWSLGGMNRTNFASSSPSTAHTRAMAAIKNQIDKNLPCIIRSTYGTSGQHWVVVVGYTPNASTYSDLYILDPAVKDVTQIFLFYNTKYYFPNDGDVGVATY